MFHLDGFPSLLLYRRGSSDGEPVAARTRPDLLKFLDAIDSTPTLSVFDDLARRMVRILFFRGSGDARALLKTAEDIVASEYPSSSSDTLALAENEETSGYAAAGVGESDDARDAGLYLSVMKRLVEDQNAGMIYLSTEVNGARRSLAVPNQIQGGSDAVEALKRRLQILSVFTDALIQKA